MSASGKKRTAPPSEPHGLEAVVETVRSIWTAADRSDTQVQAWLHKTIVDGIARIKRQVQGRLKIATLMATPRQPAEAPGIDRNEETPPARPVQQRPLFEGNSAPLAAGASARVPPPAAAAGATARFPDCEVRVYAKELVPQVRKVIPKAARFDDIAGYRRFLSRELALQRRGNPEARTPTIVIGRFFPGDHLHRDLAIFAAAAERHDALGDVLFYLTCRTENGGDGRRIARMAVAGRRRPAAQPHPGLHQGPLPSVSQCEAGQFSHRAHLHRLWRGDGDPHADERLAPPRASGGVGLHHAP